MLSRTRTSTPRPDLCWAQVVFTAVGTGNQDVGVPQDGISAPASNTSWGVKSDPAFLPLCVPLPPLLLNLTRLGAELPVIPESPSAFCFHPGGEGVGGAQVTRRREVHRWPQISIQGARGEDPHQTVMASFRLQAPVSSSSSQQQVRRTR